MHRRHFITTGVAAGLSFSGLSSRAQALPELAKIMVGFPPGGSGDAVVRRIADKLRDVYAKVVIVENRPGAAGQIALAALKAAPPDGLTLLLTTMSSLSLYPYTYKKLPYDPAVDFQSVSLAARSEFSLGVGPMVPANVRTLTDFIAWCKANPKDANFGSPAAGATVHFVGELFARAAGIPLRHVPYRGGAPAMADLLGGQVAALSISVGDFLPHLPQGKVRVLATSGATRSRFTPDIPTYVEQGFKDLVFEEGFGFYMPAKVPADVLGRANAALRAALSAPDVVDAFGLMGLEARPSTPAEQSDMVSKDRARWASLIKSIGFTAES